MDQLVSVPPGQTKAFWRGIGLRQIRLGCGIVLFAYLISHFLNHALGNISLGAMGAGVHYHMLLWQFPPVAVVFYGSALIHSGLGIFALYQRRQFSWKAAEPLQLALGLSIPLLVAFHIIGVRLGQSLFEQDKLYPQELYAFWVSHPLKAVQISTVLVIAWVHGCVGLYFWLRIKSWFDRASPFLLAAAVLVPTLALLGFYQAGRAVIALGQEASWRAANLSEQQVGTAAQIDFLTDVIGRFTTGYLVLLGLVLLARAARFWFERRGGVINLSYGNGRKIRVPKGLSVLEASLRNNVPHASVCGGRARCSTCRIRVIGDHAALPEPSQREAFVLARVGSNDPSIRLACQLRPTCDLSFFQLFTPNPAASDAHSGVSRVGEERYLVSLFVDMRGSTRLAEKMLPFDTVFVVNRFLAAVSQAVIECGGRPNQFIGDGMLALFGLTTSAQTACRQAIRAAAMISSNVDDLNKFLSHDLREPLRFGIGIHGGEVIVGDIGYRDHMVFTALGDPVNVAARLQDMTKTLACEAVFSDQVRVTAGLGEQTLPRQQIDIRGRAEPMMVCVAKQSRDLASLIDQADTNVATASVAMA